MTNKCLFCEIVAGESPSKKVVETERFLVIENKYPKAPVHLLVLDKVHTTKEKAISGMVEGVGFAYWGSLFEAIYGTIKSLGLDKTGYKLVNNGAGYNHFDHEHFHILGGSKEEPGGQT